WLGLSGPDGSGAYAIIARPRQGRPAAQCVDLLRPLRGGVPHENPAAGHDAALARAGIRAPPPANSGSIRAQAVGIPRATAGALPHGGASRQSCAQAVVARQALDDGAPARRRLDAVSRFPHARAGDLHGSMAGASAGWLISTTVRCSCRASATAS